MSRRPYAHLAGDLSTWPRGTVPTPAILRALDQYSSELVNGEDGGTWAPTDPLVVGPYASPTIAFSSAGSALSGDVRTVRGNGRDQSVEVAGLVLAGNAPPVLESARGRTITVPLGIGLESSDGTNTNVRRFDIDPLTLAARVTSPFDNGQIVSVPLPIRAQHSGATISTVVFRYKIAVERTALPANMPKFRVLKVSGNTSAPLNSTLAAPYDAQGWYVDQAATAATYYGSGQTRTAQYDCDQENVVDQTSAYWLVQFRPDDAGAGFAGDLFISALVTLSSIADFQPE